MKQLHFRDNRDVQRSTVLYRCVDKRPHARFSVEVVNDRVCVEGVHNYTTLRFHPRRRVESVRSDFLRGPFHAPKLRRSIAARCSCVRSALPEPATDFRCMVVLLMQSIYHRMSLKQTLPERTVPDTVYSHAAILHESSFDQHS